MKNKILIILLFISQISLGQTMKNTFITWQNFVDGFGKEMVSAEDVYNNMVKHGLKDLALAQFDYHFISDKKENLQSLKEHLKEHYLYENKEIKQIENGLWELSGITNEIPVTQENLMYWGLDMYKRGYEFDSQIDAYGALVDHENPKLPNLESTMEDHYFNIAIEEYHKGNLSGAIFNWSLVLEINPKDPNSYYSRGIVKNELYTWKSALKDYDKAIEIAPDFIDAIVNRGALKDENGDYEGAIEDYNRVLNFDELEIEQKQMVYFNRGNTKFNMKDKMNACKDWKTAFDLGAEYAIERINKHCK